MASTKNPQAEAAPVPAEQFSNPSPPPVPTFDSSRDAEELVKEAERIIHAFEKLKDKANASDEAVTLAGRASGCLKLIKEAIEQSYPDKETKLAEVAGKLTKLLADTKAGDSASLEEEWLIDPKQLCIDGVLALGDSDEVQYEGTLCGAPVAVKMLKPSLQDKPTYTKQFFDEARLWCTLQHPNVCRYHGYATDPPLIVTDLHAHTLKDLILKPAKPKRDYCYRLAYQVSSAVLYLHEHSIMHGNINLENIFIDSSCDAKLGNFYFAERATQLKTNRRSFGTSFYLAPELLNGQQFDLRAEVYSLGVVLYQLFAWRNPFSDMRDIEKLRDRQRCVPLFEVGEKELRCAPKEVWGLIAECCKYDPAERPAIATIPQRIAQIAVRDFIPRSESAQKHWLKCTSNGFRERIALLQFAQSSDPALCASLESVVKKAVPHWDLLTMEQFGVLSLWWPYFWCSSRALNSMRAIVNSAWYESSSDNAVRRLAGAPKNAFVVVPSAVSPLRYPYVLHFLELDIVPVERVLDPYSYQCSLAQGETFNSLTDLVAYIMEQNDLVPAPPLPTCETV